MVERAATTHPMVRDEVAHASSPPLRAWAGARFLEEKPTRLQRLERWHTRDAELEKLYAREDAPLTAVAALPYAADVARR